MSNNYAVPKEIVRKWLDEEIKAHRPPPSPDEINRMLGRKLIEDSRKTTQRH